MLSERNIHAEQFSPRESLSLASTQKYRENEDYNQMVSSYRHNVNDVVEEQKRVKQQRNE